MKEFIETLIRLSMLGFILCLDNFAIERITIDLPIDSFFIYKSLLWIIFGLPSVIFVYSLKIKVSKDNK